MSRSGSLRRPAMAATLVLVVIGTVGAPYTWVCRAHAAGAFVASATAYGVDSQAAGSSLPLGASAEGATPVAQAYLDSLGTSQGFAAAPYPGAFVASLPGTVAGASGKAVPGYPLIVSSDAGTQPSASQSAPGYALSAHSEPDSSRSSAEQGAGQPGVQAGDALSDASVAEQPDGSVEADSASTVNAFSVGQTLTIGGVTSSARAVLDGNGRVTSHSNIDVTGIKVYGQAVEFTDGRLVAAGTYVDPPTSPITNELAAAGITVSLSAARSLPGGVESPALDITIEQVGPPGTAASGSYTLSFELGRAVADFEGVAPSTAVPAANPTGSSLGDSTGGAAMVAPASGNRAFSTDQSVRLGTPSFQAPVTASRTAIPLSARSRRVRVTDAGFRADTDAVYLITLFAGLALVASTAVFRYLGVKSTWTS